MVKYLILLKKVAKSPLASEIGKTTVKELPNIYNKVTNKFPNKKLNLYKILQSDTANYLVDSAEAYGHSKLEIILQMSVISNLTIEKFVNEENNDLNTDFVSVFPCNFITSFIAPYQLKEMRESYPFMNVNTERSNKKGTH